MTVTLALTTSAADPEWEEAYEGLAFSAFALATQADDPELGKLATEVRGLLGDWEQVEGDRRRARADAIAARAHVAVADAALDLALTRIAEAILAETSGSREHGLYRRFFPEPHERVIALGLDAELPIAAAAMAQLDEGEAVPDALKAYVETLRRCLAMGNASLGARAECYANLGRLESRVEAWLETADATTRNVHGDLTRIADERGLPYHWVASFFSR
ncbi:MAG: hypothetical protein KF729_34625 [Sandaracinaceae bacterium]|nr:hypothetical protein [Sandaracinaceae bacterium]